MDGLAALWGFDRTVPLAVPAILLVLVLPAWETVHPLLHIHIPIKKTSTPAKRKPCTQALWLSCVQLLLPRQLLVTTLTRLLRYPSSMQYAQRIMGMCNRARNKQNT